MVAEELGFDSIWVGEHRLWYCGWCPAPLHALAAAAAATTRIRLGTAMYLVPQHEPVSAARAIARLDGLSGGRVELGAGLGYRDAEFDALGLRRDRRGKTMDASLDVLVLPSTNRLESYGLVQIEAMLRGVPVVASDLPGMRRPVAETGMGRLFPAGDAQALADALADTLEDGPPARLSAPEIEARFGHEAACRPYVDELRLA